MKNNVFNKEVSTQKWVKAAFVRAVKTFAQTAAAGIGVGGAIGDIEWKMVLSTSAVAFILSILTSVAGIPEVGKYE